MSLEELFERATEPAVRGLLSTPEAVAFAAVLTHGAGSNMRAPALAAVSAALHARGGLVLRCDLPYRQARASGPPRPHEAARDRDGLRQAIEEIRKLSRAPMLLGGHSYGGRQASMLAAEAPDLADALLLMSYPLHPPGKPEQLRIAHLASIEVPALFAHGSRDPFGSIDEMRAALRAVARAELMIIEGAGHDLRKLDPGAVASRAAALLEPPSPGAHLP